MQSIVEQKKCTLNHNAIACVRIGLSDGCQALPDINVQDLCPQHYHSVFPVGTMWVIEWYDERWKQHFVKRDL